MDSLPVVGVPTQTLQAIEVIPEGLPHSWVMNHRYFTALTEVSGAPFMVPLLEDERSLRALYERMDGLFLAGGVDVDPGSYGQERHEQCGRTDPDRDRVELLLARWALADGMPVFGVCRGMQVINVGCGGSLLQDCAAQYPGSIKHDYFPTAGHERDYLAHAVRVEGGTRLAEVYGSTEVRVNSMHHQGIERLGEGLRSTAWAPDGLIEALEGEGSAFVLGVQWHPEMLVEKDPGTRRLFQAFTDSATEFRRARLLAL